MMKKKQKTEQRTFELTLSDFLLFFLFAMILAILSFSLGVKFAHNRLAVEKLESDFSEEVLVREPKRTEFKNRVATEKNSLVRAEDTEDKTEEKRTTSSLGISASALENHNTEEADEPVFIPNDDIAFIRGGDSRFSGMYTIVVGEFLEYEDASLFAQGFKQRGYETFMQKTLEAGVDKIRVSLGNYSNKNKIEEFAQQESHLLGVGKYQIDQFE